jgi:hypothetical protein
MPLLVLNSWRSGKHPGNTRSYLNLSFLQLVPEEMRTKNDGIYEGVELIDPKHAGTPELSSSLQVLGAEIEHRLPLDWPNQHGTVAALAPQLGSHVMEVKKVAVAGWAGMRFDDVILGVATF